MIPIPPRVYAYAGLLAVVLGVGWCYGSTRYAAGKESGNREVAALEVKQAKERQAIANERAQFSEQARAIEQRYAADMARIGLEYEQEKKNAGQAGYDRAIAAARAGRLRDIWSCPASLPGIVPAASLSDGASIDRSEAIGRVLRIAAEGDAQLAACQAVIEADRRKIQ